MWPLLSFLLISPASFAMVCHEGYANLPPLSELAPGPLPSQQQILTAFTQKQRAWDETFRAGPFWRMLNRVTRDPAAAHDYSSSFVALEKKGKELIQAHRIFSATQAAPVSLEAFVADLSALNGAISSNRPGNELKELGRKAMNLLRSAEKKSPFVAANPEQLQTCLADLPGRMESILKEGLATPSAIGQIADDLGTMVMFSKARNQPNALLEKLNGEMQELHARLKAQAADFSYSDQKVFLSPLLKENLEKLKNALSSSGAPRK